MREGDAPWPGTRADGAASHRPPGGARTGPDDGGCDR